MDIKLEEAWDHLNSDFDIKKEYFLFTISILVRYTLEKENLKKTCREESFSILHEYIHNDSINTDRETLLKVLLELLFFIPDKYKKNNLMKRISENFENSEKSFLGIKNYDKNNKNIEIYNLKIVYFEILTYNPLVILYTGEKEKIKFDQSKITFIYEVSYETEEKFLKLGDVYNIHLNYCFLKSETKLFYKVQTENITKKIKKEILDDNNIKNIEEIFQKISDENLNWPLGRIEKGYILNEEEKKGRQLILDYISFKTKSFRRFNQDKFHSIFYMLLNPLMNNSNFQGLKNIDFEKFLKAFKQPKNFPLHEKWPNYWIEKKLYKEKILKEDNLFIPLEKSFFNFGEFFVFKEKKLYLKEVYEIISAIFPIFKDFDNPKPILEVPVDLLQNKIINFLISNKAVILKGLAGYGKTYSIIEIIRIFLGLKKKIFLITPTWKSINIYNEFTEKPNFHFSTSQKLNLDLKSKNNKEFPDIDLVIVDEMTLINDWSFVKYFVSFSHSNTRWIISGDPNQLQPIGQTFFSYSHLLKYVSEIHKKNIFEFKNKNYRIANMNKDFKEMAKTIMSSLIKNNFSFKKIKGNRENIVNIFSENERILKELKNCVNKGYKIITKLNGGIFGVDFLNRFLRMKEYNEFPKGSQIIFLRSSKEFGVDYFNGLFGEITDVNEIRYEITAENGKKYYFNRGENEDNLPFDYSYAINAHKAQGSTIKKVVVLITQKVTYEWVYTAFSRASEEVKIIFKWFDKTKTEEEFIDKLIVKKDK